MYPPEDTLSPFLKLTLEKVKPSCLMANSSPRVNPDADIQYPISNLIRNQVAMVVGEVRQMGKYNFN